MYHIPIPSEEAPDDVKAAIRTVLAWVRKVDAEDRKRQASYAQWQAQAMLNPRPHDWRVEVFI